MSAPDGGPPLTQPPSVGRIVHYIDPDYMDEHLAAIVSEVIPAEETYEVVLVALTVFPPDAKPFSVVNVERGVGPRTWHWPERT